METAFPETIEKTEQSLSPECECGSGTETAAGHDLNRGLDEGYKLGISDEKTLLHDGFVANTQKLWTSRHSRGFDDVESIGSDSVLISSKNLEDLLQSIQENPFADTENYTSIIIELLDLGNLSLLRQIRFKYAIHCPTDEDFWIQWIQEEERWRVSGTQVGAMDESSAGEPVLPPGNNGLSEWIKCPIMSKFPAPVDKPLSLDEIKHLFFLALKYCPSSPALWLLYIYFESNTAKSSLAKNAVHSNKGRRAFEHALGVIGLHALDGSAIWSAYRNYEMKLLDSAPDTKTVSAQISNVRKLFYRQLKVPLGGLPDLIDEYRLWEAELPENSRVDVAEGEKCYQIGHAEWEKRKSFEMRAQNEIDDLSNIAGINTVWNEYIDFEIETKDPARIDIIYLRALDDVGSIRQDLWLSYADYVTDVLKNPQRALQLYSRAITHFPHSCKIWINYMLCQSASGTKVDAILEVFHTSLKGCCDSLSDCIELYLTCADCVRRNIENPPSDNFSALFANDDLSTAYTARWNEVRAIFQAAEDHILNCESTDDDLFSIWYHWARFETYNSKDINSLKDVHEKIVDKFGKKMAVWTTYIENMRYLLESRESAYNVLSKLFKRALSQVEDDCDALKDQWMQFECELGSAQSVRNTRNLLEVRKSTYQNSISGSASGGLEFRGSSEGGKEPLVGGISLDSEESSSKEIICLSSIRNRRKKRRRKGDLDLETSSDASSESSVSSSSVFRKSRNAVSVLPASEMATLNLPESTFCSQLGSSNNGVVSYPPSPSSNPLQSSQGSISPQSGNSSLKGRVSNNSVSLGSPFPHSPKSSPNSAASSRSGSPTPPSSRSPRPSSRSPSPVSIGISAPSAINPTSSLQTSSSTSHPASLASLSEVERITCATWDGQESVDPSLAPNVPPSPELVPNSPPLFPHRPMPVGSHTHVAPSTEVEIGGDCSPSSDSGDLFSMPPPLYTPRMLKKTTESSAFNHGVIMCDGGSRPTNCVLTAGTGEASVEHEIVDFSKVPVITKRQDSTAHSAVGDFECGTDVDKAISSLSIANEEVQYDHSSMLNVKPQLGHHFRQQGGKLFSGSDAGIKLISSQAESSTVWVSNFDAEIEEKDLYNLFCGCKGLIEVRLVKNFKGISKGFAYVDFECSEDAIAASTELNGKRLNNRKLKVLVSAPTKPIYESKTLFISSVPECVTQSQLKEFLESQFSDVVDLRMKAKHDGSHLGYGYLEFANEESAVSCLASGIISFQGFSILLSPSIPMKNRSHPVATPAKKTDKTAAIETMTPVAAPCTIHIKNIAFSVDEKKLIEHFEQVGKVELAQICRYDNGRSKGYGFLKFSSEEDTLGAMMLNNSCIDGRDIVVSRSTREITLPNLEKEANKPRGHSGTRARAYTSDALPFTRRKPHRIDTHNLGSAYKHMAPHEVIDIGEEDSIDFPDSEASKNNRENAFKTNTEFREWLMDGDTS